MPDIGIVDASAAMERMLQAFLSMSLQHGRQALPSSSFSTGIAALPQHGQTLEQLLSRADRALYRAKAEGRARVEAATVGERITII
jgi:diguanylate cyclase (GGDEF)-like protein